MTAAERQSQLRLRVIIAFAMLYVLWGSTFLAIAVAVRHMSPLVMGGTRFVISGGLMLAWCALTGRKIAAPPREVAKLTFIGVLLLTTGNTVVGWAEKYVASGLAALLLAVTPIFMASIEAWVLRTATLSRRGIGGLLLGSAGVAVLLWPKVHGADSSLGRIQLYGAIALILAALSWTIGSLISKYSIFSVDLFAATGWQMLGAGLVNTAAALLLGSYRTVQWTPGAIGAITYLVIGGSLLGFTAYIWLLEHVPTAKVATYSYVNPLVAVVLGTVFLQEVFDHWMAWGTAIIVAGVVLVTTSRVQLAAKAAACKTALPPCEAEG